MEMATRLAENHLAEATKELSSCGWGPCLDAMSLLTALESMATSLGMEGVVPSGGGGVEEDRDVLLLRSKTGGIEHE